MKPPVEGPPPSLIQPTRELATPHTVESFRGLTFFKAHGVRQIQRFTERFKSFLLFSPALQPGDYLSQRFYGFRVCNELSYLINISKCLIFKYL